MKIIFFILFITICSLKFVYSQTVWFQLNSGVMHNIEEVFFVNENTGFAVCSSYPGIVLRTINGGLNWSVTQFQSTNPFKSVYFLNETTGFISGTSYNVFKTTNQGTNWVNLNALIPGSLESIKFLNIQTGYIAAANPKSAYIYKTTNGGNNWNNILTYSGTIGFFDIEVLDSNLIIEAGGPCMRTTNGGINWTYLSFWGMGVSFSDLSTGYITKYTNGISKTSNSGLTWIDQQSPVNTQLNAVHASNSNLVIACGNNGVIIRTINGGANWISQASPTLRKLNAVFFINNNTGWISGDSGTILKTTNGGVTAIEPLSNQIPGKYNIYQNYPNPFNPVTKIRFSIPLLPARRSDNAGGRGVPERRGVLLVIYDILGTEVATLVNEQLSPGTYEVEWDASNFPSGVYYYKIFASDYTKTRKMVLMK